MEEQLNINENNILFTNFVTGINGIGYDRVVLISKNETDKSLDLIYNTTNDIKDNVTIKLPLSTIKDININTKVGILNHTHKTQENETKGMLLSAAFLGGNPMLQGLGNEAIPKVLDVLSNNYDKVDYDNYYEIIIKTVINGEDVELKFTVDNNPEKFFKDILV